MSRLLLVAVCCCLLAARCAAQLSPWSTADANPQHNPFFPELQGPRSTPAWKWTYFLENAQNNFISTAWMTSTKEHVIVPSMTNVDTMRIDSGAQTWRSEVEMPDFLPESYPTDNPTYTPLPDGTVLGSLTKEVRATRMNDFEVPIWFNITEDFDTHFGPVMPLGNNLCAFATFSSRVQSWSRPYHVFVVDCHTGVVRWSLPYKSVRHPALALSLDGSRLFISYHSDDSRKTVLMAVNTADGYVYYNQDVGFGNYEDVITLTVDRKGFLWFHTSYDTLLKVDPKTGSVVDTAHIQLESNWGRFTIAQGSNGHDIVLLSTDRGLSAFDIAGNVTTHMWTSNYPCQQATRYDWSCYRCSLPMVFGRDMQLVSTCARAGVNGHSYRLPGDGFMVGIDIPTGKEKWRIPTFPGRTCANAILAAEGTLVWQEVDAKGWDATHPASTDMWPSVVAFGY